MTLPTTEKNIEITASQTVSNIKAAGFLTSSQVRNKRDQKLGALKELMVDTVTGKIIYAVISYGGFLGMGERLFAIPWNAMSFDNTQKRFMLDLDIERLKTAPAFNSDSWPDMNDAHWTSKIDKYYLNSVKHEVV